MSLGVLRLFRTCSQLYAQCVFFYTGSGFLLTEHLAQFKPAIGFEPISSSALHSLRKPLYQLSYTDIFSRAGGVRTHKCRNQNPVSYHLTTALYSRDFFTNSWTRTNNLKSAILHPTIRLYLLLIFCCKSLFLNFL